MVEVSCPHCGVKLKAPDEHVGKKAKCKKCQQPFRVPGPVPMAESVGEPQMLSTVGTPGLPLPGDDEDDRTELMTSDQAAPLPPLPPPKAKPAAPVAALPSADAFDFGKPAAPAPVAPKPAFGSAKAAAPAPTAKPAVAPAPPVATAAPVPAAKPAFGSAKTAAPKAAPVPSAKPAEPLPIDDAPPLGEEPPKGAKPKAKAKPAPEFEPEPIPESIPSENAFAFGFTDEPAAAEPAKPKKKKPDAEEVPPPEGKKAPKKKPRDEDDEEPEDKKPAAKGKAKAAPAAGANAFGFADDPAPPEAAKPKKKKGEDEPEDEEAENKPRYLRPEEKGSGMIKMMLITAVVGFFALGLGIAAIIAYVKANRPEPVKKEEKKEEPIPEAPPAPPVVTPPVVTPPVVPPKVDPKPKDKVDPKPKEPEPKPKEKEPEPVATRPTLELAIKSKPFDINKEPAKFDRADKPREPRYTLDSAFASVLRVFPPFDPNTADMQVVVREGAKLSLDAYSPSNDKRAARLEFTADPARPLCDVHSTAAVTQFLAVHDGKITVWNLADQKKLLDAVDPYAGKPEHQKNGIAAVFFGTQPGHVVVVSTAGAVHLFNIVARTTVSEFVPPHGAKGKIVLNESVARAEGGGSIVLAVGGILYQISSGGNLERLRTLDLGGDVKGLAVAAGGTPGQLLFAFETDAKGKKDRAMVHLPAGAAAKPLFVLWPPAGGTPKSAFWVNDSSVGVATDTGVVWFDDEMNRFGPVVVTRAATGGLYFGAGNLFWYVVPHPSKPAQSVLVPMAVPFDDVISFRKEATTKLRVVRLDSNGMLK